MPNGLVRRDKQQRCLDSLSTVGVDSIELVQHFGLVIDELNQNLR